MSTRKNGSDDGKAVGGKAATTGSGGTVVGDATEATRQHPTVRKLLEFQQTGSGFDGFWADVHDIVTDFARKSLRKTLLKGGVRSAFGDVEEASGDVVGETCATLRGLSKPGAKGRFDPTRCTQTGLSGLRGWLYRIVANEAVDWVRDNRGGRGVKITCESGLDWNELSSDDDSSAFLDRLVAKVVRADLRPVLEACIAELPDPLMRELVTLKLDEELSVRKSAVRLDLADAMVQRRLTTAYALLRPMLEARGVDAGWIAA